MIKKSKHVPGDQARRAAPKPRGTSRLRDVQRDALDRKSKLHEQCSATFFGAAGIPLYIAFHDARPGWRVGSLLVAVILIGLGAFCWQREDLLAAKAKAIDTRKRR